MTTKKLVEYIKRLSFTHLKLKGKDMDKIVTFAVETGIDEFWGAVPWAFKKKKETITTTASQESVDLPEDFDGIISIVEKTTTNGMKLIKYEADKYDRLIPDSESQNEGTPKIFKIGYNGDDGVWQANLYPTPSDAISLYVTYHSIEEGGEIPDKYLGGLIATIAQYLFIPGSANWIGANQASITQIERLKLIDDPDVGPVTRILDSSDEPDMINDNWFDEYIAGRW